MTEAGDSAEYLRLAASLIQSARNDTLDSDLPVLLSGFPSEVDKYLLLVAALASIAGRLTSPPHPNPDDLLRLFAEMPD